MNKRDSVSIISLTFVLTLAIICNLFDSSENCLCSEINKDSLPEKIQNHSPIQLSSLSFNSMVTASGTAMASVSPSSEFWESDMS